MYVYKYFAVSLVYNDIKMNIIFYVLTNCTIIKLSVFGIVLDQEKVFCVKFEPFILHSTV